MHWHSRITEIKPTSVVIRSDASGDTTEISNDFVVAMTGWRADHSTLRGLGVEIDDETVTELVPGLLMTQHVASLTALAATPPGFFRFVLGEGNENCGKAG